MKNGNGLSDEDQTRYINWCKDPNIGITKAQQMIKEIEKNKKKFKKQTND